MYMHRVHVYAYRSHILHILRSEVFLTRCNCCSPPKDEGHLRLFSTLLIGHKIYAGEQRVACWPFKGKTLQKSNRQDLVFVLPPGIDKGGFQLRIDNIWF